MNECDKGIEECQKAIKMGDENNIKDFEKKSKIYARMASLYQKQNKLDQAIELYQKSLVEFSN